MKLRTGILAVVAAAFLVAGTGCADSKMTARIDTLTAQNKEYEAQIKSEREARLLAESRVSTPALPTAEPIIPDLGAPLDLTRPPTRTGTGVTARPTTPVRTTTAVPAPKPVAAKVTIPGDVLFDSGKTTLNAAATKTLDTIIATIKSKYSGQKLVIEGYTDTTPLSKTSVWKSNADLAQARATSVKTYLAKNGIATANMTVKAMGATALASKTNQALNRRVEVAVLPTK